MHAHRLFYLLLALLLGSLVACTPVRRGGGGSSNDDDDDTTAEDDDDASDDDDVTDDDDVSDDDDVTDDDDVVDDDDDVVSSATLYGEHILAYDLGPEFEDAGYQDCEIVRDIYDWGGSAPGNCTDCEASFLTDLTYQSMTCSLDLFGGTPPEDIDDAGMGFGNGTYFEYYEGAWQGVLAGSMSGSASSGSFYGATDWIEQDGYEIQLVVDAYWN
jgi:hypothetical protein